MVSNNDMIFSQLSSLNDHMMDIKKSIGGIEEHLKNLNSKVASHEKKLNETGIDLDSLKKTVWGMIGGLAVIVLILQIWI